VRATLFLGIPTRCPAGVSNGAACAPPPIGAWCVFNPCRTTKSPTYDISSSVKSRDLPDGFSAWQAKGIVRHSLKELAQALGVEESEFKVQPDPQQYAQEQRRLRRPTRARGLSFNVWTGRAD